MVWTLEMFRRVSGTYQVTGRCFRYPGNPMGHMGLVKEHTSPQGASAPYKAIGGGEGKGGRARKVWIRIPTSFPLPPFPSPSVIYGRGARGLGGTRSRIPPTWASPMAAAPPSLSPTYMWEGGALAHTRQLPSRVRRPPPQISTSVISLQCLGEALRR